MKKFNIAIAVLLLISLVSGVISGGCSDEDKDKINVVTTTSLIAQIVERIGGDDISVTSIIPPAQCPRHYDVKPSDVKKLVGAKLFIMHNWQGEKFSQNLIDSANNKNLNVVKVELAGNWMTPAVQREATDKIVAALIGIDTDNANLYQQAATEYKSIVTAKESKIETELSKVKLESLNVLCDEQQTGFVKWTGLNVISTYGRPETFTPQIVKDLEDKGKDKGVTLVIDNMQTGGEAGKSLAEDLGVKHIVLSNFPGGYDNTETWEKAIDKNIELILESVN